MEPKVSIIIPVYNAEKYLERCFESILDNTYKNVEIIPVNDGSKDDSQKIIDSYKRKYPDIFFPIVQENQGIGITRNNGLKSATGDYIMFMDNDDFIDPDYIAMHVGELKNDDYDMVISGYKRVNDENKILFQVRLQDEYDWSRYVNIAPWARLYKAEFLKQNDIKFLKTPILEDVYFNLPANTLAKKVKVIDYQGYNWYYNSKSVSNNISEKMKKVDMIALINKHYEVLNEKRCINEQTTKYLEVYFTIVVILFLQWISKGSTYKEISKYYDSFFDWLKVHFPNYKKEKFWKITKGDRLKVRMILAIVMNFHKVHLGKFVVYLYGKI